MSADEKREIFEALAHDVPGKETEVKKKLRISSIKRDEKAQPRAAILIDRTTEYAEDMARGDKFPPVVVFQDRTGIWLADGFHRILAAEGQGIATIEADVRKGGLRDAILYSVGANAEHGTRRSNADKRQAVTKLLEDEEWSHWSDREIAKRCHVGHPLVAQMRSELTGSSSSEDDQPRTYHNRHGGTGTMRTGNIGRRRAEEDEPEIEAPPGHEEDMENAWISSDLREITSRLDHLMGEYPRADAAVRDFPTFHHHVYTYGQLKKLADWMMKFAVAWRSHV